MGLISRVLSLLHKPKLHYKINRFKKYASFPEGMSSVTFGLTAGCTNESGVKEHISIGHHCDIHGSLYVQENGVITIGNYTTIRAHTNVGGVERVSIGDHVIISNHVTIYDNNNHPTDPQARIEMCESGFYSSKWKWKYSDHKPVSIEDNVWIGEYSTILKGVTVGKGAIVASHSVVTKDVEPYTIVAGNPARKVKSLSKPQ